MPDADCGILNRLASLPVKYHDAKPQGNAWTAFCDIRTDQGAVYVVRAFGLLGREGAGRGLNTVFGCDDSRPVATGPANE
jgi:hypothetical protein